MISIIITRMKEIQRGEVTHHQDQSITLVSFRTRKMRNINPLKPIPPPPEDELLIMFVFYSY